MSGWLLALVIFHVIGFWLLVFAGIHLGRQVRCLHYCFIGISDWGIDKLKEVRDCYIAEHGKDNTPFFLLDVEKEWKEEIEFYADLLKRVRLRVPTNNHIRYFLET